MSCHLRVVVGLALILAGSPLGIMPAEAQYFGRNKVQYRDFEFQVVSTEHFDIYYYPEQQEFVGHVARMAERWYSRLAKIFNADLSGRQPLILYASSADFRQTNVLSGEIGEGTGGVTEGLRRRIIMPSAGSLTETDHVLGHELVHAFQYDMSHRSAAGSAFQRMPLWMVEGLAEYLSIGSVDAQTAMWLRDALVSNRLPTFRDLDDPRFFPYRYGHAFWAYVSGRWDLKTVMSLFFVAMQTDPEGAIREVLDMDPAEFVAGWHESIRKAYAGFLEGQSPVSAFGRAIIDRERGGGALNIAPALSPDGKRLVFLSERDLFSVELFVADAETGEVLRKLSSTATSPHFDSLQFIESAGSWAPDGRHFAQNAIVRGRGALVLFDTDTGKREREVVFGEFSEIQNPVIAPDGRRVAFVALQGGLLNLWVYDLESGAKTQLTNDAFAVLHPTFSPDGGRLAFVTDRFSTALDTLDFGNYRIAIYDFADQSIREVPGYEGALHTNPQWQPDGKGLFFVSNVDGAPNVHRVDLVSGALFQVTRVKTGIAGITPLSPSISVARRSGRLAFSARQNGEFAIHVTDDPQVLAGAPPQARSFSTSVAALPPHQAPTGEVDQLRSNPLAGLPLPELPAAKPYRSRLGLEFVGQPTVGVGVNQFGTYAGGGTSLYFSDMLGNRTLGATVQVNGSFEDIAGLLQYTNRTKRFDWGVGLEQIPFITAGTFQRYGDELDGAPVIVDEYLLERQTNTGVYAVGALPFNRAQRLEVQAGYRRVGFGLERRREVYLPDGTFIGSDEDDLEDPAAPLNLFAPSAAFVHDTSIFGVTSPITGSRARFEVAPNIGTMSYTGVLADGRAYFMPIRPLTFAFRGMHFGRYGAGAEDERFQSIFIGYPNLVRGYYDVVAENCAIQQNAGDCSAFNSLFGSRVVVANAEVRAPLLGLFRGRLDYGRLPIEIAFFADAGIAWTSQDKATFLDGDREWVRSAGVSLRFNVFGFMVVETAYARPFDRVRNNWVWSWSFTPGF